MSAEYQIFHTVGGFFESGAGLINMSGDKAAFLLHGQLTNNVAALKPGEGCYNLLLTIRGRVAAGLHVFNTGTSFIVLTDPGCREKVLAHFEKYAAMVEVAMTVTGDDLSILHACGPTEEVLVKLAKIPVPLFRTTRWGFPGCDLVVPKEKAGEIKAVLSAAGLIAGSKDLGETLRVEMGVPLYGVDCGEENLPQESRLDGALDFKKGCYFGQEVVARVHFRGHVAKILTGLRTDAPAGLSPGMLLFDEEREIGRVTSVVNSPKVNGLLGLGYVPYDLNTPGKRFQAGAERAPVEVVGFPLK